MNRVSCVIPAYNEAPRILNVLKAIASHPLIDEVVVIDDGSRDGTAEVLNGYSHPKVRILSHTENRGKSAAVYTGLVASTGSTIVFLDADLEGLVEKEVTRLIEPVLKNKVTMTMSLRGNAVPQFKLLGIDPLSGERCFPRTLIANHIEKLGSLPSFGLEVALNRILIESGSTIGVVSWPRVRSPYKYWKSGFWSGVKGDYHMTRDILHVISFKEYVHQIIYMHRKRIRI